jgi:hypothetical protein
MMVEIKRKFDKKHPLKIALEYYLDKEISYDNFASIMPKVEHQMNFNWTTSGNHTLYDYLFFSDEGLKFVAEISNELGEA